MDDEFYDSFDSTDESEGEGEGEIIAHSYQETYRPPPQIFASEEPSRLHSQSTPTDPFHLL